MQHNELSHGAKRPSASYAHNLLYYVLLNYKNVLNFSLHYKQLLHYQPLQLLKVIIVIFLLGILSFQTLLGSAACWTYC